MAIKSAIAKGKPVSYKTIELKKEKRNKYYQALALILFFLLWEFVGRLNFQYEWLNPKYLPVPTQILLSFYEMYVAGTLGAHLGVSVQRILVGYLSGMLVAFAVGSLIASVRAIDNAISPIITLFGPIPVIAVFPLFVIWFGIGESAKYILIAYSTFMYSVGYVIRGLKDTDSLLIRSASSLSANGLQIFLHVKLPSALPQIFSGIKGALGAAFSAVVVAEMLGASTGLGFLIVFSKNWFKVADMISAAIMIGVLYTVMFAVLSIVEGIVLRWKKIDLGSAFEK